MVQLENENLSEALQGTNNEEYQVSSIYLSQFFGDEKITLVNSDQDPRLVLSSVVYYSKDGVYAVKDADGYMGIIMHSSQVTQTFKLQLLGSESLKKDIQEYQVDSKVLVRLSFELQEDLVALTVMYKSTLAESNPLKDLIKIPYGSSVQILIDQVDDQSKYQPEVQQLKAELTYLEQLDLFRQSKTKDWPQVKGQKEEFLKSGMYQVTEDDAMLTFKQRTDLDFTELFWNFVAENCSSPDSYVQELSQVATEAEALNLKPQIKRDNCGQLAMLLKQCVQLASSRNIVDLQDQKEAISGQFDYWLENDDTVTTQRLYPSLQLLTECGIYKLRKDLYSILVSQRLMSKNQFDTMFQSQSDDQLSHQVNSLKLLVKVVEAWHLLVANVYTLEEDQQRQLVSQALNYWTTENAQYPVQFVVDLTKFHLAANTVCQAVQAAQLPATVDIQSDDVQLYYCNETEAQDIMQQDVAPLKNNHYYKFKFQTLQLK